jgi:hypothetical protein
LRVSARLSGRQCRRTCDESIASFLLVDRNFQFRHCEELF